MSDVMDVFGKIRMRLEIEIEPPKDDDDPEQEIQPGKVIRLTFGANHLFTAEEEPFIPLMIEMMTERLSKKVNEGAATDFL